MNPSNLCEENCILIIILNKLTLLLVVVVVQVPVEKDRNIDKASGNNLISRQQIRVYEYVTHCIYLLILDIQ